MVAEADYLNALSIAEAWMDAKANSKEEDMLKKLVKEIIEYEEIYYSIGPPNLDEAIKFRREQERMNNETIR